MKDADPGTNPALAVPILVAHSQRHPIQLYGNTKSNQYNNQASLFVAYQFSLWLKKQNRSNHYETNIGKGKLEKECTVPAQMVVEADHMQSPLLLACQCRLRYTVG